MEKKEDKKTVEEIREAAMKSIKDVTEKQIDEKLEGVTKKVTDIESELKKSLGEQSAELKKLQQITVKGKEKPKNIHEIVSKALGEKSTEIQNFGGKEMAIALKTITDESFTESELANQTTEIRSGLYAAPYSPLYLRNIFPNVTTDAGSITIAQIDGYEGEVDVWSRGTGDEGADEEKPTAEPKFKNQNVPIEWIAGTATVNRELLLNVGYLQSSIVNTLLYSRVGLFARENKLITDYLKTNAPAYDGSKTIGIEKLIDAAFNQLLGNYMNPTHVLLNQADYLTHFKFNKAQGSGEYDLPNNLLRGFGASGLETSVQVIPVPTLAAGTAYVVSSPEFEFISRLKPELMVSREHGRNMTYNRVTFLIEEMAGFVAKDLSAMVKVTF